MLEMIYRGGKGDFTEGGVRVPAFAWWPGSIEAD
jgi:arylsulfatase